MPRVSEATKTQNRERLLDAAAQAFADHGLAGAKIDDISVAAGLAKGTVYNYFESKEHLFREVLGAWSARVAEVRVSVDDDADVAEQLRTIVAADMAVMEELEPFARAAFREVLRVSGTEMAELMPATDPLDDVIRSVLAHAIERGELRSDRTLDELTQLFAAGVNGLLFERWLSGGALGLDDIVRLSVDHFLRGAGA